MNQLPMFGQNIALLIGILTCLGLAAVIGLVVVVALRALHADHRTRQGVKAHEQSKRDAHNRPLPPTGMGVCQTCGRALTDIHYFPDGLRRCRRCIDAHAAEN